MMCFHPVIGPFLAIILFHFPLSFRYFLFPSHFPLKDRDEILDHDRVLLTVDERPKTLILKKIGQSDKRKFKLRSELSAERVETVIGRGSAVGNDAI